MFKKLITTNTAYHGWGFVKSSVADMIFANIKYAAVADPGFSRGGCANSQNRCANLLFCNFFVQNCMKMKEFGRGGGARVPGASLDAPLYSMSENMYV